MTLATQLSQIERSDLIQLAQVQPELEYLFRHTLIKAIRETIAARFTDPLLRAAFMSQRDVLAVLAAQSGQGAQAHLPR